MAAAETLQRWAGNELQIDGITSQVVSYERQGGRLSSEDWIHRSYLMLYDRMHIEELWKIGDPELLRQFKQELIRNIETNLRERFHVLESGGRYVFKDGDIYSELYQQEPFGRVMLRGATVRNMKGSPEPEREGIQGELGGWLTLHEVMTWPETPVGTMVVSLSPPGMVSHSAYKGKFVDVFTLRQDYQGKYIDRKRLAVNYTAKQYYDKAIELDPDYFTNYDGRPLDAWYLSHPIITLQDISRTFTLDQGMSNEMFLSLYHNAQLQMFVKEYTNILFASTINWAKASIAFNAILNKADELAGFKRQTPLHAPLNTDASYYHYGMLPVRIVEGGGGCPSNKGMSIFSDLGLDSDLFSNSVMKFGVEDSETTWEYHIGDCVNPGCNKHNVRVGPCGICEECEKHL